MKEKAKSKVKKICFLDSPKPERISLAVIDELHRNLADADQVPDELEKFSILLLFIVFFAKFSGKESELLVS